MRRLEWDSIKRIEAKLSRELRNEEIFWGQKARQNWLKYGDKNLVFFMLKLYKDQKESYFEFIG